MTQADCTQPAAPASAEAGQWGTQLAGPNGLYADATLDAIEAAFAAGEQFLDGQLSEIEAKQARIAANFTLPDGLVYVYDIEDDSDVRFFSMQEGPDRRRTRHHDFVSLGGLGLEGSAILGDRLYFPHNLTDGGKPVNEREATSAILAVTDIHGVPATGITVPLRRLDIAQGLWVARRADIHGLRDVVDPAIIAAHARKTLGLERTGAPALRSYAESEPPRGRRSE